MKTAITLIISTLLFAIHTNAQLTPQEALAQLGRGINIGNTLDPPDGEGTWNNGPMQEYYFDDIKNAGFSTVRLPVTWCKHTASASPYTIDQAWLNRVEQIVDWGLARGLTIILNAHHEDSIKTNTSKATVKARFDSTWVQIARRFKTKSDKLLFEIINEPRPITQANLNDLNTRVLGLIRQSNPTRIVIFSGIEWSNSNELIATRVPDVNDKFLMAYYHSYDPWDFAGMANGSYGSASDISATDAKFTQVANWSASKNIPVILDEFGAVLKCNYNSRMAYLATVTEKGLNHNIGLCYWDDGGDFGIYNRTARNWSEAKEVLIYTTNESPTALKLSIVQDSAVQLIWVNRTSLNDSIVIERKKGNSNFESIDTLVSTANLYKDTTVVKGSQYYYRVRTTINKTTLHYSYPQVINVVSTVRTPYLGTAVAIPGVIEAENFDFGGEGLAYSDVDADNLGKAYRLAEGVDIEALTAGGFQVGYTEPGEWLEYSITVGATDSYKIECDVASMDGGGSLNFTFKNNATTLTSSDISIPATGGWQTMKKASCTLNIPAGNYILRANIKAKPAYNLDKYTISKVNTSLIFTEKNNNFNFTIAPNPAYETIQISDITDSGNSHEQIEIYNTQGVLQMSYYRNSAEKSVTLNVSQLVRGIYIIKIGTCNKKIVLQE